MGVNWDLFRPVDISGRYQEGYDRGQAMAKEGRLRSALAAFGQNPTDPGAQSALAAVSPEFAMKLGENKWALAQKEAERRRIGAYFAPGTDPDAAMQAAIAGGDTEVYGALASMRKTREAEQAQHEKDFAPFAYTAMKLAPEQRAGYFQSISPQLAAIGYTPDQIAKLDMSNNGLTAAVRSAMTLDQTMKMDSIEWKTGLDGVSRPYDWQGQYISDPNAWLAAHRPTPGTGPANRPNIAEGGQPPPGVPPGTPSSAVPSGNPLEPPSQVVDAKTLLPPGTTPPPEAMVERGPGESLEDFYRRRAQVAIANGADPAEINRMLASMGVRP